MIRILDWIFEGIVGWISSITSQLLDAVSALFLDALGTDMTAMEEYFPFVIKAYDIMQYTAWAVLFLIVMWQLFRSFGGPLTDAENPWQLTIRGALFALLIAYAKPIFNLILTIAKAPYISLMEISMTSEDFTFAGLEATLTNGLTTIISVASVVGLILILILEISLGWNYFKLLLETVERYVVVGVMCYTSPLAFSLGGSKATGNVFKSWCRMVGSQLLLLVMNVWFLRGFASSVGQFIGNGGALTSGKGSIFLWMFCALAYLKCAQRFDSYLGSIGLNVAQTGSSMGMELLMAARVMTGFGGGPKSAGSVFGRSGGPVSGPGGAAAGFAAGFASKFSPNSYVRDAVVEGGTRMGMSGGAGFVARAFGGMAARNGATLNGTSISSVASRNGSGSGIIAGDIADRSLANYMPQFSGYQLTGTQITGGMISTLATDASGKSASVDLFNADQFEKPDVPHSVVTASDGSQWYQVASGEGKGAFYDAPIFHGTEGVATAEPIFTGASAAGAGDADQSSPHGSDGAEDHESDASEGFSTTGYQPEFMSAPTADMDASGFSGEPVTASEMGVVDQAASGNEPDYADSDVSNGFHPEITSMPTADMDSAEFSGKTGFETAAESSMKSGFEDAFAERSADSGFSNAVVSGSGAGADDGTMSHSVPGMLGETYESSQTGIPEDDGIRSEVASTSAATPDISGSPDTAAPFEPGMTGAQQDSDYPDRTAASGFNPEFAATSEAALVTATFPGAPEGTTLRTVGEGTIEASLPDGSNSMWYNSAFYEEPDAPHEVLQSANGVDWFTMQPNAEVPQFEADGADTPFNQTAFKNFMPGYRDKVSQFDQSEMADGCFKVRNADGSGTAFYDAARFDAPRGSYKTFEDARGNQWYAIRGEAAVDRKPVFEKGKPVYDGEKLLTRNVDTVRYKQIPAKFKAPARRNERPKKTPRRKNK